MVIWFWQNILFLSYVSLVCLFTSNLRIIFEHLLYLWLFYFLILVIWRPERNFIQIIFFHFKIGKFLLFCHKLLLVRKAVDQYQFIWSRLFYEICIKIILSNFKIGIAVILPCIDFLITIIQWRSRLI